MPFFFFSFVFQFTICFTYCYFGLFDSLSVHCPQAQCTQAPNVQFKQLHTERMRQYVHCLFPWCLFVYWFFFIWPFPIRSEIFGLHPSFVCIVSASIDIKRISAFFFLFYFFFCSILQLHIMYLLYLLFVLFDVEFTIFFWHSSHSLQPYHNAGKFLYKNQNDKDVFFI